MATEKQQPTQFLLYPGLYPPEAGMGSDYVYLLLIPQNFHFLTRYMVGADQSQAVQHRSFVPPCSLMAYPSVESNLLSLGPILLKTN